MGWVGLDVMKCLDRWSLSRHRLGRNTLLAVVRRLREDVVGEFVDSYTSTCMLAPTPSYNAKILHC